MNLSKMLSGLCMLNPFPVRRWAIFLLSQWAFGRFRDVSYELFSMMGQSVECISVNRAITAHFRAIRLVLMDGFFFSFLFLLPVLLELTNLARFGGGALVAGLS